MVAFCLFENCLFQLVVLALFKSAIQGLLIDNEIVGVPQISCGVQGIMFSVQTKNPFRGNIYVRGQFGLPRCRKEFYSNDMAGGSFEVAMGDCGMNKIRQLQPQGMNYNLVIMTSFHPQFVTKVDRAFNVRCFYSQATLPVLTELEVGEVAPMSIQQEGIMYPNCQYTTREETVDGPIARTVQVGDLIVHKWECDNPNFGMLVKNCEVSDGGSAFMKLMDDRGCPLHDSVMQGQLTYANTLQMAFVPVYAFTYPDRSLMNFRCQIQVCNKLEGECMGVTPPNCPAINPTEYYPNSAINANVDPTQVVGSFQNSFYPPSQATTYPLNPTFEPAFNSLQPFQRPYATRRMSPAQNQSNDEDKNSSANFVLLPKHTKGSSVTAFKQLDIEGKASARARRAELETLDVVASPMEVMPGSKQTGLSSQEEYKDSKRCFRSTEFHKVHKPDYCINKTGFAALLAFVIVLTIFVLCLATYVFNDIILNRNKCGKGLISSRRDSFTNICAANNVRWSQIKGPSRVDGNRFTNNA